MVGGVWTGYPWQSCWESGHKPCDWQVRFWVARVFPSSAPPLPPSSASMCREDRPLASTPGTSPELMEPETSNHSIQLAPSPGPPRAP